ncbi:hypothetical protein HK414_04090 [Ramlibacter terrae]|uniref:Uncharacterized protein n=1 Tax=Ramlibacter terrae TaxID=2732511 RepID=A0ABX6P376_9BURK|nr:hypothetical protein HK414_04090 [Ramlibacter terrae]
MTSTLVLATLHGIPKEFGGDWREAGYLRDPQGARRPVRGDRLYDIEAICVRLHDAFATVLFGGIDNYYAILPVVPQFVTISGLNSEAPLSRELFEQFLERSKDFPHLNRLLYLYDCRQLVSGVQECTKEACLLVGEFYRILNFEDFFVPPMKEDDGIRYYTSPAVTTMIAVLNMVYVRLHSLLDCLTKLVVEIEKLRSDFKMYPKLASSGALFGAHKYHGWNGKNGTLFKRSDTVDEVELFRNHIIHEGPLDDMPKAYKAIQGGVAVEKFVLLPNRAGAQFARYKNRHLFYGAEDRINLRLPTLLADFQERQVKTLEAMLARLEEQPHQTLQPGE